jgi:hypothetical protein
MPAPHEPSPTIVLDGRRLYATARRFGARVVAGASQARPAREAVAQRPRRALAAKPARGRTGWMRSQPRSLSVPDNGPAVLRTRGCA